MQAPSLDAGSRPLAKPSPFALAAGALALATMLATTAAPVAQASGTSRATVPATASEPIAVTESAKYTIVEVEGDLLALRDEKTKEESWVRLGEGTAIRAKNKKAFDGRKKLTLSDLAAGQLVKVTRYTENGSIARVRVLETS